MPAKTIADIALDFGGRVSLSEPTRRCLGHAERKTHRAPQDQFGGYMRKNGHYEYYARCKDCRPIFVKQGNKKHDEDIGRRSTGPQPGTAIHEYFCLLKPVAHELRAEGMGDGG